MKVLKFGGTSVGTPQRIREVAALISSLEPKIVVLSAMAGTTNKLVEITDYLAAGNPDAARELTAQLREHYQRVISELFATHEGGSRGGAMLSAAARQARDEAAAQVDLSFATIRSLVSASPAVLSAQARSFSGDEGKEILAQGELISTALMLAYLRMRGVKAAMLPALKYMRIQPDGEPDMPYITQRLRRLIDITGPADVYITQGFICRNQYGDTDNLKRGGSDYTATIVGAAIDASEIQIWTDIDGMHNNDPRYVEGTKPVPVLHFDEAAELAYFGAKILHPACVIPARQHGIPIRLLNTLQPSLPGTLICSEGESTEGVSPKVTAVSAKDGITVLRIRSTRMFLAYSFLLRVFEAFDNHQTPIDLVATSEVSVSVAIADTTELPAILDSLRQFATVEVDSDMAILCVVGRMRWDDTALQPRVLEALEGIPVRLISYGGSDRNIAVVVPQSHKIPSLNALQSLFL